MRSDQAAQLVEEVEDELISRRSDLATGL